MTATSASEVLDALQEGLCRRCQSPLAGIEVSEVSTAWGEDEEIVSTVPARRCPICTWLNVNGPLPQTVALRNILRPLTDEFPMLQEIVPDADNPEAAQDVIGGVASLLLTRLYQEIQAAPRVAGAWLESLLRDLHGADSATGFHDYPVLIFQLVYVIHLLTSGPVAILERLDSAEWPPFWREPVFDVAYTYVRLSSFFREVELGLPTRVVDGVATATLSAEDVWMTEVNANLAAEKSTGQYHVESFTNPLIIEAERAVYGYSLPDFVSFLSDESAVRGHTRLMTSPDHEVKIIDLEGGSELIDQIAADFMLTLGRLHSTAVPSFYFAAPATASREAGDIIEQARIIDWLSYSPLLEATYLEGGRRKRAAFTSGYLLHRLHARAASAAAYRFRTAVGDGGGDRSPDLVKRLRKLERTFHAEFETKVKTELENIGFRAAANIEKLAGQRLPCGEIDVLGAIGLGTTRPVLVVIEAKNTDVSFYKDFGASHAISTMNRAREQVTQKAVWVRGNWQTVLSHLFIPSESEPLVVMLTVSRYTPMPLGKDGPATLALRELRTVVSSVADTPVSAWRPDLRGALVP